MKPPGTAAVESPRGEPSGATPSAPSPSSTPPSPPLVELFSLPSTVDQQRIKEIIHRQVEADLLRQGLAPDTTFVIVHDERSITRFTADRVYRSLRGQPATDKKLVLSLNSPGGSPSAAYLISKLCRRHSRGDFSVAVPRRAKSAATLVCCGADRLHMGSMSELGPIDPQLGETPLLALRHSIEHIAQITSEYPGAARMFSDYLGGALRIEAIGYFERVAVSALQYAHKLLAARADTSIAGGLAVEEIAKRLVYGYKDHGFVIDAEEAAEIFGASRVTIDSIEYLASNDIYESLELMDIICRQRFGHFISYIGRSALEAIWLIRDDDRSGQPGAQAL